MEVEGKSTEVKDYIVYDLQPADSVIICDFDFKIKQED